MNKSFEELRMTGRLPSPPGVGMAILRLTQVEDFAVGDIARAIQSDPALTGRVLKLSNSSRRTSVAPVTTVDEAIQRLGVRTIRSVALGFSLVSELREGGCSAFDYSAFWSESLARAVAAHALSAKLDRGHPAEAYCCALLAGIGRLTLAWVHPDDYARIIVEAKNQSLAHLLEQERRAFDIDHAEIAEVLLSEWGLPDELTRAIGRFAAGQGAMPADGEAVASLVMVLQLSDDVARICVDGEMADLSTWHRLEESTLRHGLDGSEMHAICDEVVQEWAEWGGILRLPTIPVPSFASMSKRASLQATTPVDILDFEVTEHEDDVLPPLRILAVDDERLSLRLLTHHLQMAGHEILVATNGREALQLSLEQNPDIIVSDWKMPEMNGLELTMALRRYEVGRAMYVIILTG
ncbi:MAG: HDOD domain-containing protein, partial [Planctomycetes bacterium]|nr:HDOD domain-containing protein [Planctomycetota bacterium]